MAGAVVPGAGEEAMVGGEEGAKGEEMASVRLLVVCFGRGERVVDVEVARARERGGSLRRTSSC